MHRCKGCEYKSSNISMKSHQYHSNRLAIEIQSNTKTSKFPNFQIKLQIFKMASSRAIFATLAITYAVCIGLACGNPVPADAVDATMIANEPIQIEAVEAVAATDLNLDTIEAHDRDGRFYGTSLAQASAMSSANGGYGGYGYPYGGGFGGSSAQAAASAQSIGFGKK